MKKKKTDAEVETKIQIWNEAEAHFNEELAKLKNEVEDKVEEARAIGILQTIEHDMAYKNLLKYAVLYQTREKKSYKKRGMIWEVFCSNVVKESARNVNRKLDDLSTIYNNFQDNLSGFLGLPFNKIRYLGKSLSSKTDNLSGFEDNAIIIDGVRIPLSAENKDEIEAAIDALKAANEEEKEKVKKLEKNIERTVKEETRGLTAERDLLIQENKRLKAFAPDDKEPSEWSLEQAQAVDDACAEFDLCVRSFVFDKRLKGEYKLQAHVEAALTRAERSIRGLIRQWYEEIDPQTEAF